MTVEHVSGGRIGFFTIATNEYVLMLENQLEKASDSIKSFGWQYVIATDRVQHLNKFLADQQLTRFVRVVKCPPYRFPLASMLRFKYIKQEMRNFEYVCYIDCDMDVEDPERLHQAIISSRAVGLVSHPGWARAYGKVLSAKEKLMQLLVRTRYGSLGSWELRRKSLAWVPRRKRRNYFAGGIFFGPGPLITEMCSVCDDWMDSDMKSGLIAAVHDESYLNRWATLNRHVKYGPDFCYAEFPWLPSMQVVVRALDKRNMVQ